MRNQWLGVVMVMLGLAAMGVVASSTAFAAMIGTYVEAEGGSGGNSVNASTGDPDDWWTTTNSDTDNLWCLRTEIYEGYAENDAFEASGTNYEDCPVIKTTISGLTVGKSYEIRVIYASENNTGTDWVLAAGLASDSLTRYHWGDGVSQETGVIHEDEDPRFVLQMQVLLGTVVSPSGGEISAYIDMPDGEGRARYDGLTYLEIPEPATMGLLLVGGLGMLIRRKR